MASTSAAPAFPFPRHRSPEDTVTYALFPPVPSAGALLSFHRHILSLLPSHLSSYIWQREPFHLSLPLNPIHTSCPLCHSPPSLPHLHGSTRFADAIADEWFVVSLVVYLTKQVPGLAVKVWDSDGEFLLIEAAYALPSWVNPENSTNRVFIYGGDVHIVPNKDFPDTPSLEQALSAVRDESIETRAPNEVQLAVKRRLEGLPERAMDHMHRIRVRVPVTVAQVLKMEPSLISLAVEGFYDRDVDMMKHAARMERFLDGGKAEMVRVAVVMSKVMYAQLVQQRFQAPRCYPMPSREDVGNEAWMEAELGMKIACGFEMIYQERRKSEQEGEVVTWEVFKKQFEHSGCLSPFAPASEEYKQMMEDLFEYYNSTSSFFRTRDVLLAPVSRIDDILSRSYSVSDYNDIDLPPSDDDSWLYSGEDRLNSELTERQKEFENYEAAKMHRKGAKKKVLDDVMGPRSSGDFNLADITDSMQEFVRKVSSFEGAEVPDNRSMKPVEFDADQFLKAMESALGGMPKDETVTDDEHDRESLASDMEFEEDGSDFVEDDNDIGGTEDSFMQLYSAALNKELGATSLQNSFTRAQKSHHNTEGPSSSREMNEDLTPVDINLNLVESLLSSYSSQQGLPGPASNLLGLMGVQVPPDSKKM